ncbi:hypothetical protein CVIRNUC_000214 [Coccomyxa viridis]|uniref:Uncharacterized protein n=1 Tax=Coccomyxa viridis TaxID=1274662 RepID=A0AAV1HT58_9CHLO|nr:hypothetical protein CVIRNUC_000214 [Coccomyxa viridis]
MQGSTEVRRLPSKFGMTHPAGTVGIVLSNSMMQGEASGLCTLCWYVVMRHTVQQCQCAAGTCYHSHASLRMQRCVLMNSASCRMVTDNCSRKGSHFVKGSRARAHKISL